jgi:hypothetical protein
MFIVEYKAVKYIKWLSLRIALAASTVAQAPNKLTSDKPDSESRYQGMP